MTFWAILKTTFLSETIGGYFGGNFRKNWDTFYSSIWLVTLGLRFLNGSNASHFFVKISTINQKNDFDVSRIRTQIVWIAEGEYADHHRHDRWLLHRNKLSAIQNLLSSTDGSHYICKSRIFHFRLPTYSSTLLYKSYVCNVLKQKG